MGKVQYSVALKEDGSSIDVEDAEIGKPYKCLDPDCSARIFRRGGGDTKVSLHFYHKDKGGCKGTIKSIIHYETAALVFDIFHWLITNGKISFAKVFTCINSETCVHVNGNRKNSWYNSILYDQNKMYWHNSFLSIMICGKRKLDVAVNKQIYYNFLKGVDNAVFEHNFRDNEDIYRPDVSLCKGENLVIPFEIYFSNIDDVNKTAWYRQNKCDVVKIDVSNVHIGLIRALKQEWKYEKNAENIISKLNIIITINNKNHCKINPFIIPRNALIKSTEVTSRYHIRKLIETKLANDTLLDDAEIKAGIQQVLYYDKDSGFYNPNGKIDIFARKIKRYFDYACNNCQLGSHGNCLNDFTSDGRIHKLTEAIYYRRQMKKNWEKRPDISQMFSKE